MLLIMGLPKLRMWVGVVLVGMKGMVEMVRLEL